MGADPNVPDAAEAASVDLRGPFSPASLLDAANHGLLAVDHRGHIAAVNPAGAALLGYAPAEMIGRPWFALLRPSKSDGCPCHEAKSALAGALLEGSRLRVEGETFWRQDGTALKVAYQTAPIVGPTGIAGAVMTFLDRGEPPRGHAALTRQLAINELLSAVAIAANRADTLEAGAQEAIDRVCAFLGWPVGHLYVLAEDGASLVSSAVWHLDDAAAFQAFRQVTTAMQLPLGVGLPGRVAMSGQPRWIADVRDDPNFPRAHVVREIAVRAALGVPVLIGTQVAGVLEFFAPMPLEPDGALLDVLSCIGLQLGRVAERQLAAVGLARAEALAATERMKNAFINTVSHELRTPLTTITGNAEFLADGLYGQLTPPQLDRVAGIQQGADQLRALVDEMIDFARLEAGALQLVMQDLDVGAWIRFVATQVERAAAGRGLRVATTIPEDPLWAHADPVRASQALHNMLDNAIKFTPAGGLITVSARACGDRVRVEVADTGPGIAAGHVPHVFEKFYQADGSTTRAHGGSGLGLAIARAFVTAHGGEIGVDTSEGHGATFWFTLPSAEGAARGESRSDSGDSR
jgi:PAS domain S-box-containing protein